MAHTAGLPGWSEPLRARGPGRLGAVHLAAGRPGAVVGAGHRLGLPRRDPGLPDRRGGPPDHRRRPSGTGSPRGGRPARGRLLHRAARVGGRTGCRSSSRPPPMDLGDAQAAGDRHPGHDQPAARRHLPAAMPGGAGPRSRRPTATATPGRWPWCSRSWPAGARPGACGCCRSRAATGSSTSRSDGTDLVLGLPIPVRHGLRAEPEHDADRAPGLLLGRLRRLAHRDGPGRRADRSATP